MFPSYPLEEFSTRYARAPFDEFCPLQKFCSSRGPWIAGGAVRRWVLGEPALKSDIDFFCSGEAELNALRSCLKDEGYRSAAENEFNISYQKAGSPPVQLIKLYSASLPALLDSFDFTLCQFGTDGKELFVGPYTLWDTANKRLVVHKISFPAASIRRLLKYASQGFTVCPGAATALLTQVVDNPTILDRTIEYID